MWFFLNSANLICRDIWSVSEGWLGVAKVLCILCHWGIQLISAYSWARLAILVAGKGRRECFYFFCFFPFIPVSLSSLPLSFISSTMSSIYFLPFSERWHKMTHKGWCVVKPQHNQIEVFQKVSWTSNKTRLYDVSISNPTGGGIPLMNVWHFIAQRHLGDNCIQIWHLGR